MTTPSGITPPGSITDFSSFAQKQQIDWETQQENDWSSKMAPIAGMGDRVVDLDAAVQAMIDDVALLNGIPAYGAVYQAWNTGMPGTGSWTILPFNKPVGPRKNVSINGSVGAKTTGGLVVQGENECPGLWEISVLTYVEDGNNVGVPASAIKVQIPVWDVNNNLLFMYETIVENSGNGSDSFSIACTLPFVIPSAARTFAVMVYGRSGQIRKFNGGVAYSGLWLRRVSLDVANTAVEQTVADA